MEQSAWLDYVILGNTVFAWGIGIVVFAVSLVVFGIARGAIGRRLAWLAERRSFKPWKIAAHTVGKTKSWFLVLAALALGAQAWVLQPSARTLLGNVLMIGLLLQVGLWAGAALDLSLRLRKDRQLQEHSDAIVAMDVLGFVVRLVVWAVVILVILDNLDVKITALVASLGIGGIAVALATQNILSDLFASLSILLDKPFVVGDSLAIDEYSGTVEKVGVKTTRLRSVSGEQLVFSNNDLLSSRIRNFGRMFERRAAFTINVPFETPADKLRRVPIIVREALEAQAKVRFDRSHFQKFGNSALVFETVYHVLSADYKYYMDVQQAVNLIIYERFAEEGIDFAYTTKTTTSRTG